MEKEEYIETCKAINEKIYLLNKELDDLNKNYIAENMPCSIGSIVNVFLDNGDRLCGVISDWKIDKKNGIFIPELCQINENYGIGRIKSYSLYDAQIVEIQKIGEVAKCADCIYKETIKSKLKCCFYQFLERDILPDELMCDHGKVTEDFIPFFKQPETLPYSPVIEF